MYIDVKNKNKRCTKEKLP